MMFSIYKGFAKLFSGLAGLVTRGQGKLSKRNCGLKNQTVPALGNSLWVHCASLGEFEQGKRVIDALRMRYPNKKLVLTFYSSSGYEKKKDYKLVDHVLYLPYDTPQAMVAFVAALNPELVVFIKYEFWFTLLDVLHKRDVPFVFVSSVFRSDQYLFRRVFRPLLNKILNARHIFVQNISSKTLLSKHGYQNVTVAGDTRVDRVIEVKESEFTWSALEQWRKESVCVIAGSTWSEDEKLLVQAMSVFPGWKWIIAPHEIDRPHIKELEVLLGEESVFLSSCGMDAEIPSEKSVLVIDQIGLLSVLYRYGDIAYVGGGLGAGIHNTLEPTVYGLPVVFGSNYQKFQEAVDFCNLKAARVVTTTSELVEALKYFEEKEHRIEIREILENYFRKHEGATDKILSSLEKIIAVE